MVAVLQALDFEPQAHVYSIGGRIVPSVTQILKQCVDFSKIPADLLEAARVFGKHVHEACDLFNRGALDWERLDPALAPYVRGWQSFLDDSGAVVIASEMRLYHAKLNYAGTPDCALAWGSRIVIPDIKTPVVVPPTAGPQTAAYAQAYKELHGGKLPARYCIRLLGDGTYKTFPRTDPADWSLFLSALNVFNFKVKNHVAI